MASAVRHRAVFAVLAPLVLLCALVLLTRQEHRQRTAYNAFGISAGLTMLHPGDVTHEDKKVAANAQGIPDIRARAPPTQPPTVADTQEQAAFNLALQGSTAERTDQLLQQKGLLAFRHKQWFGVTRTKDVAILLDGRKEDPKLVFLFDVQRLDEPG